MKKNEAAVQEMVIQGIISNVPFEALLADPRENLQVYIDTEKGCVELTEDIDVPDTFLKIPTEEELYSYGNAICDYVTEQGIELTDKCSAAKQLHTLSYWEDFLNYRRTEVLERLRIWLEDKGYIIFAEEDVTTNWRSVTMRLNDNSTFDKFYVGGFNRDAFELIKDALSRSDGSYIIKGFFGYGRKHLLQAFVWEKLKKNCNIEYMDAGYFNFHIERRDAQGEKFLEEFITRLIATEVLIIADIEQLLDKVFCLECFVKILEYRIQNKKQVLLSCDADIALEEFVYYGKTISKLLEKAKVATITVPEYEFKEQFVRAFIKAEKLDDFFNEEIIRQIILNEAESVAVLKGYIYRVVAESKLAQFDEKIEQLKAHLANSVLVFHD